MIQPECWFSQQGTSRYVLWYMALYGMVNIYVTINVLLFPLVHNINTLETYKIV